jgi:RNA polymerase sigma factor (sigma-70 family)
MRAGDDSAFDAIYDRYHRGLLAFCRHMLGSRHEAEDVLQQSFASAYLTLRRGTDDVALRPWLYTIARNRCLSEMRARREHLDVAAIVPGASSLEGLAAEVQRRSDLRDLVEDVQRLPEDQRAALVLFELGDHSHEAIAEVLGVRREKVKALVFQAREGLMRARRARETPCAEIRAELASLRGKSKRHSMLGIHLDRCPDCAAYDVAVRRQRRALAVILPVAPTAGLKASVLASTLGGGAAAVGGAGAGATGGGVAAVGSAAAGGGGVAAAGGAAAGGGGAAAAGGGVAGTAAAGGVAGSLGGAGAAAGGAVAGGAAATGVAGGIVGLGAKTVVAQLAVIVAVAGGGAPTRGDTHKTQKAQAPPSITQAAPSPAATAPPPSAPIAAAVAPEAADRTPDAEAPAAPHPADQAPATAPSATIPPANGVTTAATPASGTADPTPAPATPAAAAQQTTLDTAPATTPTPPAPPTDPTPVPPNAAIPVDTTPTAPPATDPSSTGPATVADSPPAPTPDTIAPATTDPPPAAVQESADATQSPASASDVVDAAD